MSKKRVLIIGLDGATWNVIDDTVLDRSMPTLKNLKKSGCSGILRSTEPAITPAAWTSCITGCSPATHGIAGFRNYSFEDDTLRIGSAADCRVPNIFQQLSDQGFSVAAINVPWTYPCSKIKGIMIAGYGSPGIFTYPEQFKNELLAEIPGYDILPDFEKSANDSFEQFESKITLVEKSFAQRLLAAALVTKRLDWDLMMLVFQDLDKLGHFMWPCLDADKRDSYPKKRDRIFSMFARLDSTIAEILKLAGDDDLLVAVVSDHGMGPKVVHACPNSLLHQWGYLKFQNPLQRMLRRTRRNISSRIGKRKTRMPLELKMPIDWSRSKALLLLADVNGHLFLNLKGRQPKGTVEPGTEYETILDDLKKRFSQVKCPVTAGPLFEKVVRPEELFNSADVNHESFGDLVLVPSPGCFIKSKLSRKAPYAEAVPADSVDGCHRPEGMFLFSGKNVKPAKADANIIDIAPTVYAALGAKLPPVDGRVLTDIFSEKLDVRYSDEHAGKTTSQQSVTQLSADEQEIIEKRLTDLGYLG